MTTQQLLFITGFQKSGTSLLNRVLMSQDFIENPFLPEGKFFWGDEPVGNPTSSPCGELYQKHLTKKGYQLLAEDFEVSHQNLLLKRIEKANVNVPILMNKNPNLVVRLPWLKKIFPECKIIVVLREPVANIYSFSKKLYKKKQTNNDYWWGIKPENWEALISSNSLTQIVSQWKAVFSFLVKYIDCVDLFINYSSFCDSPEKHLLRIANNINLTNVDINIPFEGLTCMDGEYKSGGSLESKNILLRRDKSFEISKSNLTDKTYHPFSDDEVKFINNETDSLWELLINKTQDKLIQ
ncbi:sulfotransferase [Marinicella gelatinilytica]|uniref:sulfotransferase n=1 Tax=Marinicella gelatinilytica TaxID=2996017 RepID=UPI00226094D7|nr:sulfotransferase [Marinicella gelatinilytica]MCX7545260.1 sulfotransferase [Marinicella gelatinilytica]